MSRQIESKDSQIGMVLASKFDKPVISQTHAPAEKQFPLDYLMDVPNVDDEEFLNKTN